MVPISANIVAARIIPITPLGTRPGFIGARTEYDYLTKPIENWLGDTGVEFTPRAIPKVEFLSAAADTSQVVYFFLKRVG